MLAAAATRSRIRHRLAPRRKKRGKARGGVEDGRGTDRQRARRAIAQAEGGGARTPNRGAEPSAQTRPAGAFAGARSRRAMSIREAQPWPSGFGLAGRGERARRAPGVPSQGASQHDTCGCLRPRARDPFYRGRVHVRFTRRAPSSGQTGCAKQPDRRWGSFRRED